MKALVRLLRVPWGMEAFRSVRKRLQGPSPLLCCGRLLGRTCLSLYPHADIPMLKKLMVKMILRKDIVINFPVPKTLSKYMAIADEVWEEKGDDIDYSFAIEDVEGLAKEFMLRNVITQSQCYRILERYGCR